MVPARKTGCLDGDAVEIRINGTTVRGCTGLAMIAMETKELKMDTLEIKKSVQATDKKMTYLLIAVVLAVVGGGSMGVAEVLKILLKIGV